MSDHTNALLIYSGIFILLYSQNKQPVVTRQCDVVINHNNVAPGVLLNIIKLQLTLVLIDRPLSQVKNNRYRKPRRVCRLVIYTFVVIACSVSLNRQ